MAGGCPSLRVVCLAALACSWQAARRAARLHAPPACTRPHMVNMLQRTVSPLAAPCHVGAVLTCVSLFAPCATCPQGKRLVRAPHSRRPAMTCCHACCAGTLRQVCFCLAFSFFQTVMWCCTCSSRCRCCLTSQHLLQLVGPLLVNIPDLEAGYCTVYAWGLGHSVGATDGHSVGARA